MDEQVQKIRSFIVDTFLFGDGAALEEDTSFIQKGIIDSTGILELIHFLEKNYSIQVHDNELIPENLDSLKNIDQFLNRKLSCAE